MSIKPILIAILIISAFGCRNSNDSNILSENSGLANIKFRTFKIGKTNPISWTEIASDSIGPITEKNLKFNALPEKPFDIGDEKSLLKPMDEKKFDWNSVPDTLFDFKNLPSQKLTFKSILMDRPSIMKPSLIAHIAGGVRGILDFKLPKEAMGKIRCSVIDEDGFIWLGSEKGLFRYDGNTIEAYEKNKGLPNLDITFLYMDRDNKIWIAANFGSVYIFDKQTRIIQELKHSFIKGPTYGMMQDREGKFWIPMGGNGILIIDRDSNYIKEFTSKQGLSGVFTVRPYQDKADNIWLPTDNGLTVVNQSSKSMKRLSGENVLFGKKNRSFVAAVVQDSENNDYYISGAAGLQILNFDTKTLKKIDETHGLSDTTGTIELIIDSSGKFWIGGQNGNAFTFDNRTKKIKQYNITTGENKIIYNFTQDEKGQIWIGSIADGLFIYNPTLGKPGNFTIADGLGNNRVWSIKEDKNGYIWIGTYDGIDIYNPQKNTIKHIGKADGLPGVVANNLTLDTRNRIWASGFRQGLAEINLENNKILWHGNEGILKNIAIRSILSTSSGDIWIGTASSEIFVYTPQTRIIKKYVDSTDLAQFPISHIHQDKKGLIWVVSNGNGIKIINPITNTIQKLSKTAGLSSNNTVTLCENKDEMWIGTSDNGIEILNLSEGTIASITKAQGLINEEIWTLNEWNERMYAGTTSGLSYINIIDNKSEDSKLLNINNITRDQGLSYVDFAANSSLITSSNQLWAGVENQILTVIDEPINDTSSTQAFITGFNVFDEPLAFTDDRSIESYLAITDTIWKSNIDTGITDKKGFLNSYTTTYNKYTYDNVEPFYQLPINLKLPFDQNYVNFTFTGRQYNDPGEITYRYFLEGIDKSWSAESKNTKSENYRDLPSGDYTFKVISKGLSGKWSHPAEFSFEIIPPWWKRWWAYIIYLIIAGIVMWNVHLFQKQRTIKREQDKIKDRELEHAKEIEKAFKELEKVHENLKSTQAQLIQSEKMASLGELTAGIAHEIQNPLNFVNNFSEINKELLAEMIEEIEKGNFNDAKGMANDIVTNEEKIIHHGKRADAIVKGMLQHSRSSSHAKELVDINALCDEYLRLSYHGLRAKDKSFNSNMETDFDTEIDVINIVPQDIGRVILNLLTNAFYAVTERKKTEEKSYEPKVTISTKLIAISQLPNTLTAQTPSILITIKDNGIGIPESIRDKIFQPFYTTKPSGKGTGLGLSLSYDIIKAHGGEIKVTSSENVGTEFIIQLPFG